MIGPTPAAMALATITVMLWIIWSDTIRARRPSQILYVVRIALFLIVTGMLILNMVRQPDRIRGGDRTLTIVAAGVGILGAGYFARRLALRK
jgi:low affinity Fe/Cu permease